MTYFKIYKGFLMIVIATFVFQKIYGVATNYWSYEQTIVRFKKKSTDKIISYLSSTNHRFRHIASNEILSRGLPDSEIFRIILMNLNSQNSSIFCTGVNIIKDFKKTNVTIKTKLIETTKSENDSLRGCSARALGVVANEYMQSFNQLMLLLEDKSGLVRQHAMEAIVNYGDLAQKAIPLFINNFRYSEPDYVDGKYLGRAYYGSKAVELIAEIDPFNQSIIDALLLQIENPYFFSNAVTASKSLAKMAKTNPQIIDIVNKKLSIDGRYARPLFAIGTDKTFNLAIQAIDSPSRKISHAVIYDLSDERFADDIVLTNRQQKILINKFESMLKTTNRINWGKPAGSIIRILLRRDHKNAVLREFLNSSINNSNQSNFVKRSLKKIKTIESSLK